MVACGHVTVRRLGGRRSGEVRFGRFLSNRKVTTQRLIEGWSEQTASAVAGRHVLAIQDTSELKFPTTAERRRGLGEIGNGIGHGLLVHSMLALDAETGGLLGLLGGTIWTRRGRVSTPHGRRPLSQKESQRWVNTAQDAKPVLAGAATVTYIADRESDIYAVWAKLPEPNRHVLARIYCDRRLAEGGTLYDAIKGVAHHRLVQAALDHRAAASNSQIPRSAHRG